MTEPKKAIDFILKEPWAIRQDALENIIAIANRKNDVEAVEARLGKPLNNTQTVTTRGDVAIVPVIGPIFRYANLFTRMSGATSLEVLARDFTAALDDPSINSIVLEIDSPGGMAAGISEFADMVRAANKKVVAYASNDSASAAYWIGAAAHEFVISDTAQLGSIGVIAGYGKDDDPEVVRFISSQSPRKRLDMASEDDRAAMQGTIDDMADVFVNKVASFRGVSRETVLTSFGQGWVLVGERAVEAGMADRLGSLESVIAGLSGNHATKGAYAMADGAKPEATPALTIETLKSDHPDIYQAVHAEGFAAGKTDECNRIQSVESAALPGHEELIGKLKFDGKTTGEQAALQIIQAEKSNKAKALGDYTAQAPQPVSQPAADDLPSTPSARGQENMTDEERLQSTWDSDKVLRAEFGGDFEAYKAFETACSAGQVKILKTNKES